MLHTPELSFLDEVEALFSVLYPESFRAFCRQFTSQEIVRAYPGLAIGNFILSVAELKILNQRIGEGEWGDYERAIFGRQHSKIGACLWGGLLPFFYAEDSAGIDCYGFSLGAVPTNEKVLVWSAHSIVHEYRNLHEWLEEMRT